MQTVLILYGALVIKPVYGVELTDKQGSLDYDKAGDTDMHRRMMRTSGELRAGSPDTAVVVGADAQVSTLNPASGNAAPFPEPEVGSLRNVMAHAILSQDSRASTEATSREQSWRSSYECGTEGQPCNCNGVAEYGFGEEWVSLRVEGSIACTAESFAGAPDGLTQSPRSNRSTAQKSCLCYSLVDCHAVPFAAGLVQDTAHRRREQNGVEGTNSYQRRRWCGFGQHDCEWGDWGEWGDCLQGTVCKQSELERTRTKTKVEANGGGCLGRNIEFRA